MMKNIFPLCFLNIQYLKECINFKLKIFDKLCNFKALQRSPSQSQEFEKFTDNLELNVKTLKENPVLVVAISDFNAKLKNWYFEDSATFRECIRQYCLTTWIKIGHNRTNTYSR